MLSNKFYEKFSLTSKVKVKREGFRVKKKRISKIDRVFMVQSDRDTYSSASREQKKDAR